MITNPNQISSISDLRFKTKSVLKKSKDAPVFLFNRTVPEGVLLSLEKYQEMTDAMEDYFLSLKSESFESEDKKKVEWVPLEEVKTILAKK
ncbi:hypothetical protein A3D77_00520 [Candidatus Gottesmanbacteria bacterium RIFCSPHIGHO2_02_FULL_39_11]|uniref:Antitoxin n=1 Tax=Candidatus Gottesmanbacteria bacterium RIFCSPHIGHO2_02_FULL_39_11 TaxID=1798382 RepID=A0A1F5ZL33_9BACT|nr:MAG: hypothetical protein A3D77_00520 [Candidatus Gottesmanbacteria bacterium RIFCSPHIGHO2_02_FULL_39_11]